MARILKHLVAEFRECSLKDIEKKCIEGEPKATINTVLVAPDLTVDGNGKLGRRHRREGENGGNCKIHPKFDEKYKVNTTTSYGCVGNPCCGTIEICGIALNRKRASQKESKTFCDARFFISSIVVELPRYRTMNTKPTEQETT